MKKQLTDRQYDALAFIGSKPKGEISGYELKVCGYGNTQTLKQLASRGYVSAVGLGHMAAPASATFRITRSGIERLASPR